MTEDVGGTIERSIHVIRGERVMLDRDLAALYGVETRALNQAVRRNPDRFPPDFMFQLEPEEIARLRSQIVTLELSANEAVGLRSQIVTSKKGRGGARSAPYAFTEQGVAMLSSVLHSSRAVAVNVEIMRAFVRLRGLLSTHADLARKLELLEQKYDGQFRVVFEAIWQLMKVAGPERFPERKKIGF